MKLYYTFIFSVIAHLVFYEALENYAIHLENRQAEEIEVILLDDGKERQFILDPNTPKADALTPTDTPYLSKENRQFNQQQKAPILGNETRNRSPEITQNQKTPTDEAQQELMEKLKAINEISQDLLQQVQKRERSAPPQPLQFDPSPLPSTVNDPFTGIPIGSFTAVNTNRYLYYSYFERIDRQVRNRWVQRIRQVLRTRPRIPPGERSREEWTSQIEIILDKKGDFVRADVVDSSGISALDFAAIDAFRDGAPIPNPPEGLIDEDGLIFLRYAFRVYWRP